jgi:hypothetical protein
LFLSCCARIGVISIGIRTSFWRSLIPPSPLVLLDFLFGTLARKVPPIGLRECAAVARYLDWLSWEAGPGSKSLNLRKLAGAIWGTVLQHAEFKAAGKEQTIEVLLKLADTQLAGFDVAAALETVRSLPTPKAFRPLPALRTPFTSVTMGPGTPQLATDLSERIYAGYWAVRLAGIRGARQTVADALNRHHVPCPRRDGTETLWTGYEVTERVKQFEKHQLIKPNGDRKAGRQWLVEKWNHLYYPNPAWDGKSGGRNSEGR